MSPTHREEEKSSIVIGVDALQSCDNSVGESNDFSIEQAAALFAS